MSCYRAPDPTPEQIENGRRKGYDPYDRGGSLPYWDFAADDTLAAAAVIHDEMTLIGGPQYLAQKIAENFARDCYILARAVDHDLKRMFEISKAAVCARIVFETESKFWRAQDLNTDVTRAQGAAQMLEAKRHINLQAAKLRERIPYPEAANA